MLNEPTRTRVGTAALFYTASPQRDDMIVEEIEDGIWLVMGEYVVRDEAMSMYLDDLIANLFNVGVPSDGDVRQH